MDILGGAWRFAAGVTGRYSRSLMVSLQLPIYTGPNCGDRTVDTVSGDWNLTKANWPCKRQLIAKG